MHGYADRLSAAPGDTITFMVSCDGADDYNADLVRLIHGDTNPRGPGFKEEVVAVAAKGLHAGRKQPIDCGSYVLVEDPHGRLANLRAFTLFAFINPTTPERRGQGILTRWCSSRRRGYGLIVDRGCLELRVGPLHFRLNEPLQAGIWHAVAATFDPEGSATLFQQPIVTSTNSLLGPAAGLGGAHFVRRSVASRRVATALDEDLKAVDLADEASTPFLIAACSWLDGAGGRRVGGHYNGKIDCPQVHARALHRAELEDLASGGANPVDAVIASWDLARGIGPQGIPSRRVVDISGHELDGECVNMPGRGVTGHNWTGMRDDFRQAPDEYAAIHFHSDDLDDARWSADFEMVVPDDLPSGVYAARVRGGGVEDHIPFFVRPKPGHVGARIAFLAPTATYMAYANGHDPFASVTQPVGAHTPILWPADVFLNDHPEYGLSLYDTHVDGSGVAYASRLRPMLDMRPRYRSWRSSSLWGLPADLCTIDWLQAMGHEYDVITDEDLHHDGLELLRPYAVIISGSHPEYCSRQMLDGVEAYISQGGRLMYLGANGFYWVISYHPELPHIIELRRGEAGSRAWQAAPGEYHHSTTGERGGLWRNRARPPQKLVGVGFTSEGFDASTYYRRLPDSFDSRAAFIFDGIGADERIGDFGLVGGGAAGLELDRYDLGLGTPPDALLLAASEGHSDAYQRVVEEITFLAPGLGGTQDPRVRADMVYFANARGGAVFSTGSIAWSGSLSAANYRNNVSRITNNVLVQFAKDERPPWA